jgi:hypothetical protein
MESPADRLIVTFGLLSVTGWLASLARRYLGVSFALHRRWVWPLLVLGVTGAVGYTQTGVWWYLAAALGLAALGGAARPE